MQPFPHSKDATDKIWLKLASWSWRYNCLKVWTTTDNRALLYYKLTLWAFGSGELKMLYFFQYIHWKRMKYSCPKKFSGRYVGQRFCLFHGKTVTPFSMNVVSLAHHISQPGIICTMLRNTFWWHFLLMLGIHARHVLWDIANCARVDATSESSDQGHSEVKGQIGAFWSWKSFFYHLCNKIQVNPDFLIQLTTIRYSD